MQRLEIPDVSGVLFMAVLVAAFWTLAGFLFQVAKLHRNSLSRRRPLPRWLRTALVSLTAVVALPKAAFASSTNDSSDTHDRDGGIDPMLAASLGLNAGFLALQLRRNFDRLRKVKFGAKAAAGGEIVHGVVEASERQSDWRMVARVLGPPVVECADGRPVAFDKGKSLELVVWMVEHRENSTRSAARTALWDGDVKDSTFSNVVSEARRALQSVDPMIDEEWIPRTFSDELPLHDAVVTDSQLLNESLRRFMADRSTYRDDLVIQLKNVRNLPFSGANYGWADGEGITTSHVIGVVKAAVLLAEYAIELDDNELLFMATERGLRVLPGHEELVSLRMKGHARSGNRTAIKYEWESYTRAIEADSWAGAEPSPELEKLARELSKA